MGFWSSFLSGESPGAAVEASLAASSVEFSSADAAAIIDGDAIDPAVFGLPSYGPSPLTPAARVERKAAMQVGTVARAHDLVPATLGSLPFGFYGPDNQRAATTAGLTLLAQPERDVPASITYTKLFEDLYFEKVAWWRVVKFGWHGYPTFVTRVDNPRAVDPANRRGDKILVGAEWVPIAELIRFDSPRDGLLTAGARAIRKHLLIDAADQNMVDGAPPVDYFTPNEGADPVTDTEVKTLLADWQEARRLRSTGYVPAALKYNVGGFSPRDLQLAEARKDAVLEICRHAGIDPEDVGVSTTSRTYQNAFDRKQERINSTLRQYFVAVQDRLSMGDVSPLGYRARLDLDALLQSDPKTRFETYQVGLAVGAITPEQIQVAEGNPTVNQPRPTAPAAPAPPAPQEAPAMTVRSIAPAANFDGEGDLVTFDAPAVDGQTFTVDAQKRTITGLVMPYGVISGDGRTNDGRKIQFSQGSIQLPADPGRIKLLIGHDWNRAVGKGIAFEDTEAGLVGTFRVARGVAGDEALSMAEDGVWDGLSGGFGEGVKTRLDAATGIQHVTFSQLRETSQTPRPAYDGARITQVAATAQERNTMPCDKCGQVHALNITACDPTALAAFTAANQTNPEAVNFDALGETLKAAVVAGFASLEQPQRQTVDPSAPGALEVNEPSPYRFDGLAGEHGFVEDLRSYNSDGEARQRLETFVEQAFAVTSGNVSALNPTQNRPDLYVPNLTFNRPLYDLVTKGQIVDKTPFTVPKFSSASGLVSDHTEGVEPTPGSFTATNQTITPAPVSGKVEIVREVWDQGGSPQADAIVWQEMLNAYYEAVEAKIAARLATTATAELNLASAVNDALVDALTAYYAGLQFVRGGNRFTATAADSKLFLALIAAKGSDGRKLLPVLGPNNAQGTVGGGFDRIAIGNQAVAAAWALAQGANTRSYSFVPSSVWVWTNAPKRFTFEYQVKSIDMALWGYVGSAILRDSDVKPIDYDASDA